jgi:very-short-patch-repair endonuclease
MTIVLVLTVLLLAGLATLGVMKNRAAREPGASPVARRPLGKQEQPMFQRLCEAFPDQLVLAQVSLSALLTASHRSTRGRFERQFANFVVCSREFDVLALIELDDASHARDAAEVAARDGMLAAAGYRVLRFKRVPSEIDLRTAVMRAAG